MTAVALQYPSSYTQDSASAEAFVVKAIEAYPRNVSASKKFDRRYGIWIAVVVSVVLHAWAVIWVHAPESANPALDTGTVSVAIGSLAFTPMPSRPNPIEPAMPAMMSEAGPTPMISSQASEPVEQPIEPHESDPVPSQAPSSEKQKIVMKPVAQPSQKVASEVVEPQPVSSPEPVKDVQMPPLVSDLTDASENTQDMSAVASATTQRMQLAHLTSAAPSLEAPMFLTDPDYRSPPKPPVYPQRAIRFGQEGTAMVRAQLSERGDVIDVELRESSGHALLDKAALKAVRQWLFKPAKRDGRAVLATVDLPVRFKLQ